MFTCGDDLLVDESRPVWQQAFSRGGAQGDWVFERLTAKEFEAIEGRDLVEAALSPPLFGPSKVLLVSPADKITKKKIAVAEEIAALGSSSLKIVFVASSRRALPKGRSRFPVIEIDPLRPGDVARWLRQRYGLAPEVARYLVETVGTELRPLAGEMEKLTAWVQGSRPVETDDVDLLILGTEQFSPFELDDAVLNQDCGKAVRVAGAMIEEGIEPLIILSRLARTWRQVLIGKALSGKASPRDIAAAAGIPSWKAAAFGGSSRKFTWERIIRGFGELVASDRRFKTTGADPDVVLKLLLWKLLASEESVRRRSDSPVG